MRIYDISRSLTDRVAVWPGDQPFAARWSARIAEGSSVNVGAFEMSTHAGTHVDAPLHYLEGGASVDQIALESFIGPAHVIDVGDADAVAVGHVEMLDFTGATRILFKTRSSYVDDDIFNGDFAYIEPATIRYLAKCGVVLIGTDAPSVDPFDSISLPAHHELAQAQMVNLENLWLSEVEPGKYHLTALPLKLGHLDAAPVRAILVSSPGSPGASH